MVHQSARIHRYGYPYGYRQLKNQWSCQWTNFQDILEGKEPDRTFVIQWHFPYTTQCYDIVWHPDFHHVQRILRPPACRNHRFVQVQFNQEQVQGYRCRSERKEPFVRSWTNKLEKKEVDKNIFQKNQKYLIDWLSRLISDFWGWFLWFEKIRIYPMADFFKTIKSV